MFGWICTVASAKRVRAGVIALPITSSDGRGSPHRLKRNWKTKRPTMPVQTRALVPSEKRKIESVHPAGNVDRIRPSQIHVSAGGSKDSMKILRYVGKKNGPS